MLFGKLTAHWYMLLGLTVKTTNYDQYVASFTFFTVHCRNTALSKGLINLLAVNVLGEEQNKSPYTAEYEMSKPQICISFPDWMEYKQMLHVEGL